jgi:hypothetical protein
MVALHIFGHKNIHNSIYNISIMICQEEILDFSMFLDVF